MLFAAVQEQLESNRRPARQSLRGARYLLQGLVTCGQCGYAYYGKALSRCSRRGRPRDYAYYRCLGTDAYRFGGERVCDNAQVRTDRLEAVTWHEVSELLREPDRLEQEYRIAAPAATARRSVAPAFSATRRLATFSSPITNSSSSRSSSSNANRATSRTAAVAIPWRVHPVRTQYPTFALQCSRSMRSSPTRPRKACESTRLIAKSYRDRPARLEWTR